MYLQVQSVYQYSCLISNRPPADVSTNLYGMLDILNCTHLHKKYKKKNLT